jgi:hypothetical protein
MDAIENADLILIVAGLVGLLLLGARPNSSCAMLCMNPRNALRGCKWS